MKYHIYVKGAYLASTIATLEEIKKAFPYSETVGNCVCVYAV